MTDEIKLKRISELEALLVETKKERDESVGVWAAATDAAESRASALEGEREHWIADYDEQRELVLLWQDRASTFEALLAECETMLIECSGDLAEWIEAHYSAIKHFPSEQRRYERDMDTSVRADALLARLKARTGDA